MSQIYGNSALTLIAEASRHANDGLFNTRLQANRGTWLPSEPEGFVYNPMRLSSTPWARDDLGTDGILGAETSTVSTRGWTLQEELMSRCSLFCIRYGLLWTCPTRVQREWVTDERHKEMDKLGHLTPSTFYYPEFLSLRHETYVLMQASPKTARIAWMEALSAYLRRKLSRNGDRLAAIAGLVKVLRTQLKDNYVAGMWLQNIPEDFAMGENFDGVGDAAPEDAVMDLGVTASRIYC